MSHINIVRPPPLGGSCVTLSMTCVVPSGQQCAAGHGGAGPGSRQTSHAAVCYVQEARQDDIIHDVGLPGTAGRPPRQVRLLALGGNRWPVLCVCRLIMLCL